MANAAEVVVPAGTVTEAGTVTLGSLLAKATVMPPAGAGALSATLLLPVADTPPTTDFGDSVMDESATIPAGVTVNVALLVTPL
jgi:hypothetical protein